MELYYRRPSFETRNAMCKTALNLKHIPGNRYEEIINAEDSIKKLTRHEHVKIVNSGNSAILSVMSTFKDNIIIPDQGGWIGFKKMAEFLNIKVVEIPTHLGLIETNKLKYLIEKFNPEALFITSFAGYSAEQPIKDIYNICDDMDVILVEDASGGIGDENRRLGNGEHAHVIIGSTGTPKTVNVGNGGFISTNNINLINSAYNIIKSLKADPITCTGIASEIQNAPYTLSKTLDACNYLKSEIMEFREVLYGDKYGLNIIIPDKHPKKLRYQLKNRFNVHGGSIITVCPNYNRVKINAICIEIKNLDIKCMTPENLDNLIKIIKSES